MGEIKGALLTADGWVQGHASSPHTRRKYQAQLQQFCEWMLVRGHDFESVESAEIEQYLADVAWGHAVMDARNAGRARSQRTLDLARSVLRSLFHELVRQGHCRRNPVDFIARPHVSPVTDAADAPKLLVWLTVRDSMLKEAAADRTPRSPLQRMVAIAELAYWAGLRRSELASAVMSDFTQVNTTWWLKLQRFGRGRADLVEVPSPAMETLALYRSGRNLSALPSAAERTVPLVARLRSEHPVQSWTIANTLKRLASVGPRTDRKSPAILDLRKELVSTALKAKIPPHELARHVRSRNVVDQLMARIVIRPIGTSLAELAG